MKAVVAREVERFLFRPGLQERARYYGVVFLNQMPLSHAASHGACSQAPPALSPPVVVPSSSHMQAVPLH